MEARAEPVVARGLLKNGVNNVHDKHLVGVAQRRVGQILQLAGGSEHQQTAFVRLTGVGAAALYVPLAQLLVQGLSIRGGHVAQLHAVVVSLTQLPVELEQSGQQAVGIALVAQVSGRKDDTYLHTVVVGERLLRRGVVAVASA